MLPKLYSIVTIARGTGRVIEVGAAHFIVRIYDVADVVVHICDQWES